MKQGVGAVALVVKEKLFSVATKLKVLLVAGGWHQELGGWHQGGFWRVASGAPEGGIRSGHSSLPPPHPSLATAPMSASVIIPGCLNRYLYT